MERSQDFFLITANKNNMIVVSAFSIPHFCLILKYITVQQLLTKEKMCFIQCFSCEKYKDVHLKCY